MISFNGLTVRLGGYVVLDRASASLPPKSRVGLVGRNGAGKSTLLKIIAGIGAFMTPAKLKDGEIQDVIAYIRSLAK